MSQNPPLKQMETPLAETRRPGSTDEPEIVLHVNGASRAVRVEPERSLLGVLRDELGLTGAKYGCGEGQCGACIVLVAGEPVPACVTAVSSAAGWPIQTIEGLSQAARADRLHPLQQAFLDEGALQCGYCTPGMIMAALGLLQRNLRPSEDEIVTAMQPNVCRCGAYPRIVRAIRRAAAVMAVGQIEGGETHETAAARGFTPMGNQVGSAGIANAARGEAQR
jgi:aerobic-type carbon monoxide dehydrogenase small subunit (CoxS/CutS family)